MPYVIRVATALDVPHIVHHREQMFRDMGTRCDYAAMAEACTRWYREAVPDGAYRGWMAEHETQVVGGGGLIVMPWSPGPLRFDPRCAFVFNMYVEPPHRGRDLARRLMEAMHAWCRSEGIERMALNASRAGQSVYERLGYAAVAEPMMRLDL
ncbi:MAG: GNAT family N-acetyltransferase [Acidobacteriota bacterium]|nr:GNAT family N-acetyltransferase [Acidobacteriota bacterium]